MNDSIEYRSINFDKIAASKHLSAFTRLTAINIKNNPYSMLGEFFKDISQVDLDMLSGLCDRALEGTERGADVSAEICELIVLAEMLATAEGMPAMDDKQSHANVNFLMSVIACVSMERKGITEVFYENISFGDDMRSKEIVRLKG